MPANSIVARLKPGREKPAANGHPWIFSGAISKWDGEAVVGSIVDVVSHDGTWLGRGLAHPKADLAIRLYAWREGEAIDGDFFDQRIDAAAALRERIVANKGTNSYRLIFSESDGLSGLIVDRYADVLAIRIGAAALVPHLPRILNGLKETTGVTEMIVGADKDSVEREQLDAATIAKLSTMTRQGGTRSRASADRQEPVPPRSFVEILENGFCFEVDLAGGQKTGFYLDQRDNRARVAAYARGRRVLSAYCYTGAFEVYAAKAGAAEIIGLDSSAPALEQARRHLEMNAVKTPVEYRDADVPLALRKFRDEGRTFDLIILDPPRFVQNAAQKEKGMRAYKDINLLGLKLLAPGGILATFSCSGLVTMEDLKLVTRWAAKDSKRTVRFIEGLGQPPDHPILSTFPEAEYLSGLLCHVD